jgi:hypothetical protein
VAKRKVEQLACEHGFDSIFIHIPLPRSFCFVAVSHFSIGLTDPNVDNASNYSTGRAAASLTSTAMTPETRTERAMFDEEECKRIWTDHYTPSCREWS